MAFWPSVFGSTFQMADDAVNVPATALRIVRKELDYAEMEYDLENKARLNALKSRLAKANARRKAKPAK